ncbi:MAG TPA: DUF5677 domain-containing protein [Bryobacteraceae bacterium]|nr:DUF5677 domain-containing protein [Bryobacteraceae bacterium]
MTPNPGLREEPARFFSTLTSLNNFDKLEIRNVIRGLLSPTQRETCFISNYYRAFANVESILALNHVKHVQGIASAARGLFEIAVDVALIDHIPQGPEKMLAIIDVEKMRSAQAIVDFKTANPTAQVDATVFQEFLKQEGSRIVALRDSLWPNRPDVQHWSLLKMQKRVEKLGLPFNELYAVEYPRLSWYIHSGLTGFVNLEKESFELMAGIAFTIAVKSYMALMAAIIDEFKLNKHDPKIKTRMQFAQMVPWTDGGDQAAQLSRELGL